MGDDDAMGGTGAGSVPSPAPVRTISPMQESVRPIAMEAWDNRVKAGSGRMVDTHGGNEFMLILDPGTTVVHAGREVPAPPGTLFLHLPVEEHGIVSDGAPTRLLVINYEPDEPFEARFPSLGADAPRRWHLDGQQLAAYMEIFTRLQVELDGQRTGRAEAASAWVRLLLVLVARLAEPAATAAAAQPLVPVDADIHRLRRAIDLRRQGSASGALQGMVENYDALRHRFRRTYGESPGHMLARLRIEKAKAMLTSSEASMAEIAQHCGYARQHEFSRAFHRVVGCTPTAFRRQFRHG